MTRNLLKRLDKTSRYALYLDEKTMPGVNIIVRRIYGRLFLYLMNSTEIGRPLHKDLSLEEKTMPHIYVIVSCI